MSLITVSLIYRAFSEPHYLRSIFFFHLRKEKKMAKQMKSFVPQQAITKF